MNKQLSGFTLLEVLIGMSLLSIMMLLLFASLRTCVQSWNAGEKKIAAVSQATIVQNFLRNKLQTALPLNADFLEEEAEFSFQGEAHSLQFVAPMPASAGRLGLQLFTISLQSEEEEAGQQLLIDIKPFFPQNDREQWQGEQVVILKKIHELNIAYFGIDPDNPNAEPRWHKHWLDQQSLPELVSIDVELTTGAVWPQLVVAFKVESALNATTVQARSGAQRNKANLFGLLKK
jgi:general secretion pathway protein J